MRRPFVVGVSLLLVSAFAIGKPAQARYRITLVDGRQVMSVDVPIQRGTVLTFHSHPGGTLTGVPSEMVVEVAADRAAGTLTVAGSRNLEARPPGEPLAPGEALDLGPMGDGAPVSQSTQMEGANAAAPSAPVFDNRYLGGYPNPLGANSTNSGRAVLPNGTMIGTDGLPRVLSSTDLTSGQTGQPIAGNGFPATSAAPTVIGPNGTPTLAPGVPGSSTTLIGPNGTPVLSTGTTPVVIGPNGTPVLTTPAQGAPGPAIGSNGTPILAPAGGPGSAAPVIGPNGTPFLAPAGQRGAAAPDIGPNGTPSAPPPGGKP